MLRLPEVTRHSFFFFWVMLLGLKLFDPPSLLSILGSELPYLGFQLGDDLVGGVCSKACSCESLLHGVESGGGLQCGVKNFAASKSHKNDTPFIGWLEKLSVQIHSQMSLEHLGSESPGNHGWEDDIFFLAVIRSIQNGYVFGVFSILEQTPWDLYFDLVLSLSFVIIAQVRRRDHFNLNLIFVSH